MTFQEKINQIKKNQSMKNCKNCGAEFEPKHATRGAEQIYCTKKCNQISAKKRREEKIINDLKIKMSNENLQQSTQDNGADEIRNMAQRTMGDFSANRWNHSNDAMATIEKLYETKNENQFLKFKLETLEKENLQLEAEIDRLETELELSEVEEEGGILSGIVDQFKKDPTNTINFAKSFLNDYLKK
jgi:uncharacterized Zn ribbon protein